MKSSPNNISENVGIIVNTTNHCNLFALNIGIDAGKLGEQGAGSQALADKVRSLADRIVVINSENHQTDRNVDVEKTIVSLHELAQKGRTLKDTVKKIRKI